MNIPENAEENECNGVGQYQSDQQSYCRIWKDGAVYVELTIQN